MHFFFSKRFLPLFVTQFLGAFNDNFMKNALVVLITYRLAERTGMHAQSLVAIAVALFILPYFLFSALSGQLADKVDRRHIAIRVKMAEIILVLLACAGFYWGNVWFSILVLFGMGTHSTFFGPIKYALLPQHLQQDELLSGNAWIEAGTFLAILIGTITGGLFILTPDGLWIALGVLGAASFVGYVTARQIPAAPAPVPDLKLSFNIFKETAKLITYSRSKPAIHTCILAISWFWFVGATFLAQFPAYASEVLHADETVMTSFLTMFSIGIGIGSFLCNHLLRGQVRLTWLFWSALGMSAFAIDLYFASVVPIATDTLISASVFLSHSSNWRILFDLFMLALCGGIYIVPLYAYLQQEGEAAHMARLIATNNVINAVFMVASSLFILAMIAWGASIPGVFLIVGILNLGVALWVRKLKLNVIS